MSHASVSSEHGAGGKGSHSAHAAAESCSVPYNLGRILLVCVVAFVVWVQLTRTSMVPGGAWAGPYQPSLKLWCTITRVGVLPWVFAVFLWQVLCAYNRSASNLMSSTDPERRQLAIRLISYTSIVMFLFLSLRL